MNGIIFTRESILTSLEKTHTEVTAFFHSQTPERFYRRPSPNAWSYAENLDHLIKSVRPLTQALRLPKITPRLLFGRPKNPSRSFEEMKVAYVHRLDQGAGASGRYLPAADKSGDATAQSALLERWGRASNQLMAALNNWKDADMDRYSLPHPLLGTITVREILFFTIYHSMRHMSSEGD
jgi:hypothetical protein